MKNLLTKKEISLIIQTLESKLRYLIQKRGIDNPATDFERDILELLNKLDHLRKFDPTDRP